MLGLFNNDYVFLLPELFLIYGILCVVSLGVTFNSYHLSVGKLLSKQIGLVSIGVLLYTFLLYLNMNFINVSLLGDLVERNSIGYFAVCLVLVGGLIIMALARHYVTFSSLTESELFMLFMLVILGSCSIIFSNDFLGMYLGIELQGLGLYILATLKTNSTFSTEAGLKYFVLGAFASSILIFGISLFYGFTGILSFSDINLLLFEGRVEGFIGSAFVGSFLLILMGLIFKVGGAPFHSWVPDVYEGSPTIVTGFFSIIPKLGIFTVLIKIFYGGALTYLTELNSLLLYCGVLSIFIGSLGALTQNSIKRLVSYSAIGHTGFILIGLSTGSVEGLISVLFYLAVYVSLLINIFSIIIGVTQRLSYSPIKLIGNLRFLTNFNPVVAASLGLSFFSIAGIPPLSGFFSKFLVFFALIKDEYFVISVVCIFLSVISSVYYLRVIRGTMLVKNTLKHNFFFEIDRTVAHIIVYSFLFNILFVFFGLDLYTFISTIVLNSLY